MSSDIEFLSTLGCDILEFAYIDKNAARDGQRLCLIARRLKRLENIERAAKAWNVARYADDIFEGAVLEADALEDALGGEVNE